MPTRRTRIRRAPHASASGSRLDAEQLIAEACNATGLSDFGDPDPRESLRQLVDSLNNEAALTPTGAMGKRAGLIRVLANRLWLNDAFRRDPQLAAERIRSPIVILGLPRSGTTKLHRMIAADPGMQKLPLWRLLNPVRTLAPSPAGSTIDARVGAAQQFVEALRTRSPDTFAAHPMDALEPDEEYFGMELSFLSHLNTSSFHTPSYEAWLNAQSFVPWYHWLEKLLQYSQHCDGASGRPWVLRPSPLGYLSCCSHGFRRDGRALSSRPDDRGRLILRVASGVASLDELACRRDASAST
jgi:hypothetical protein